MKYQMLDFTMYSRHCRLYKNWIKSSIIYGNSKSIWIYSKGFPSARSWDITRVNRRQQIIDKWSYMHSKASHIVKTLGSIAIRYMYRQISNISRTKSQNLTVSCLVLQMSMRIILKPGVQSRMEMFLKQRRQAMLQLHLSDQQFDYLLRCALY